MQHLPLEGARCTACTWGNDYDSDLTVSDDDLDMTAAGTYKWFCEVHILLSYTSKLNHRKNPSRTSMHVGCWYCHVSPIVV
jgi:hypothetical protein